MFADMGRETVYCCSDLMASNQLNDMKTFETKNGNHKNFMKKFSTIKRIHLPVYDLFRVSKHTWKKTK